MKFRNGFVSNSSSASFIIRKNALTEFQLAAIRNLKESCKFLGSEHYDVEDALGWDLKEITQDGIRVISGYTDMDNFDFLSFAIDKLYIKKEDIIFDHDNLFNEDGEFEEESLEYPQKTTQKLIRWIRFERGDKFADEIQKKVDRERKELKKIIG